jgi:DegT/DnrJ/EryC1/StrS aminotransferase family
VIGRRQLTVASPISPSALLRAFLGAARVDTTAPTRARELVVDAFRARDALLTDSGTSALVLALRLAASGGAVALPAYGCVDLVAAALFADVRVRLYDLDPITLSPDLDSIRQVIRRGVDAIVVTHLFGYAADVRGVLEVAAASGVVVIEDAAQGAGGELLGARLGSHGPLSVLSFGRGKGLCAGGGGALLANDPAWLSKLGALSLADASRGVSGLVATSVQLVFGRPALYAIPAAIPWLRLGETVYHPAAEPQPMSQGSALLVASAIALEAADLAVRRANASAIADAIAAATTGGRCGVVPVRPIASSRPGYLRFALRDDSGALRIQPSLGIVRPYPGTLGDYPELGPALAADPLATPGAEEIAKSLFTVPTHRFTGPPDIRALGAWLVET